MATDDFLGTGALSGNWTATLGSAPERSSGVAISASGTRWAHYSGASFADDQFAEAEVSVISTGFSSNGVTVRASTTNGGTFYGLRINGSSGDVAITKRASFSGPADIAASAGGIVPTSGFTFTHTLRLEAEGTTLRGYLDDVEVVSTTDATITSGAPGIQMTDGDGHIDNWEGNDLAGGTDATINATTVTIATELPAVTVTTTASITPNPVTIAAELPAPTITTTASITPSTVTIAAELPTPTVNTGILISPDPVVVAAELPGATITATASITPTTVPIVVELPTPTITSITPSTDTSASPVVISVVVPAPTIGGDAVQGAQPLWRIGGYPCPSNISRSTGPRALANR